MANEKLKLFLGLCEKTQEIIFDAFGEGGSDFFWMVDFDYVAKLTPIEQMFEMANWANFATAKGVFLYTSSQSEIFVNGKKYIVDFLIDGYEIWGKEKPKIKQFYLKKPLIVELDGKEYHSTTKQINHDYQRETDLKLAGYDIIRFTGSQIYNDVYGCVDKVCKYVIKAEKEDDTDNVPTYKESK